MQLTRLKGALATAKRGHKLLKDKQDEMVRRFMLIIRHNQELRESIEKELASIMRKFNAASLTMSYAGLMEALMVPTKSAKVNTSVKNIMSVRCPTVEFADDGNPIDLTYGFVFTPSDLDSAILSLSNLLPKLIELAEIEKTCDMLASEIEKTRRRVNAIEYVMIPNYEETIHFITMKLDDAERSNTIRLMKSKDIILAKDEASKKARESAQA